VTPYAAAGAWHPQSGITGTGWAQVATGCAQLATGWAQLGAG